MRTTHLWTRTLQLRILFSGTCRSGEVLSIHDLPNRVHPSCAKRSDSKLPWGEEPRNVMIVKKSGVAEIGDALVEFAEYWLINRGIGHITTSYPGTDIEPSVAHNFHHHLSRPVYAIPPPSGSSPFPFTQSTDPRTPRQHQHPRKASHEQPDTEDGSDHTSCLSEEIRTTKRPMLWSLSAVMAQSSTQPRCSRSAGRCRRCSLSFVMGTLGFLGEFKWAEYKTAYASLRHSGAIVHAEECNIRAGVYGWQYEGTEAHAMNELSLHRGRDPHLAILEIYIGPHLLTEAVADGIIVGGSILHPSVPSLLLTSICPRSLSFRRLVLPEDAKITLRLSERNRGREVAVSVDRRRWVSLGPGQEVRVYQEGGIPCVKRLSALKMAEWAVEVQLSIW
ncbi:ATP-NAD kinase-like domain-containing protein [Sphaerosporella brunnea]|uniref:ATP-NAD kinase-like domain-containing protein n=1 Tax=Sphaerosporella brunnea TaxID=1250544 RepID=A0A5J5FAG4_9PEZI|nr:ATP-NAD kinase-like domain-containing protein [Sphaerosporella brunnea]